MKKKDGSEVLKLFEQSRKNLLVNENIKRPADTDKEALLKDIKVKFYDGILADLIELRKFRTAQAVYGEKLKEGLSGSISDKLTGLSIFGNLHNAPEFQTIFEPLVEDSSALDEETVEKIGNAILHFA
jgi:hypothetical protein